PGPRQSRSGATLAWTGNPDARGGHARPGSRRPLYPCARRSPPGSRRPDRKLCSPPRWCVMTGTDVPRMFPLAVAQDTATGNADRVSAGQIWWGGWDSNPGPADYESAALTG